MPHFAPMNWQAALLMFWLNCAMLTSMMWWNSNDYFHINKSSHVIYPRPQWTW